MFNMQACRDLNNNGTCVDDCPDETIIENGAIVQNPAFRVEAGTQCIVPPCPGKFIVNARFLHGLAICVFRWFVQTEHSVSNAVSY